MSLGEIRLRDSRSAVLTRR